MMIYGCSLMLLSCQTKLFLTLASSLLMDSWAMVLCGITGAFGYSLMGTNFSAISKLTSVWIRLMFMMILVSCFICFSTQSMFCFLVFLELCVMPMLFLILYMSKDSDKFSSCFFMISLNMLGSIPFMLYCTELHSCDLWGGSSIFYGLIQCESTALTFCFSLILLSKLPVLYLHFWLTKAHVSSAGACSMLLASLMLKLGSFGLIKFPMPLQSVFNSIIQLLIPFSLFCSIFFSFMMIRYIDLKSLVACSSIIHMSFLFPFSVLSSSCMNDSSLMMMIGHGATSLLLFYLVSLVYESLHNRSFDFSKSMESSSKTFCMIFLVVFCLNFGVPPFINFLSEIYCALSVMKASESFMVGFLFTLLSYVLFFMFVATKTLFGKKILWSGQEDLLCAVKTFPIIFLALCFPMFF